MRRIVDVGVHEAALAALAALLILVAAEAHRLLAPGERGRVESDHAAPAGFHRHGVGAGQQRALRGAGREEGIQREADAVAVRVARGEGVVEFHRVDEVEGACGGVGAAVGVEEEMGGVGGGEDDVVEEEDFGVGGRGEGNGLVAGGGGGGEFCGSGVVGGGGQREEGEVADGGEVGYAFCYRVADEGGLDGGY